VLGGGGGGGFSDHNYEVEDGSLRERTMLKRSGVEGKALCETEGFEEIVPMF